MSTSFFGTLQRQEAPLAVETAFTQGKPCKTPVARTGFRGWGNTAVKR
jgi:hypothetical protein